MRCPTKISLHFNLLCVRILSCVDVYSRGLELKSGKTTSVFVTYSSYFISVDNACCGSALHLPFKNKKSNQSHRPVQSIVQSIAVFGNVVEKIVCFHQGRKSVIRSPDSPRAYISEYRLYLIHLFMRHYRAVICYTIPFNCQVSIQWH